MNKEEIEYIAETYKEAVALIRDLAIDAEKLYEEGFEPAPHIAAAQDLVEHETSIRKLEALALALASGMSD